MPSPAGPPARLPHPDHRFSLANERTLLAWLRTALALVAGGVAMTQFAPELGVPAGGPVVSVGLLLAGPRRYVRNERAIAADEPLPVSPAAAWVTVLIAVLVAVLLALVVVHTVRGEGPARPGRDPAGAHRTRLAAHRSGPVRRGRPAGPCRSGGGRPAGGCCPPAWSPPRGPRSWEC